MRGLSRERSSGFHHGRDLYDQWRPVHNELIMRCTSVHPIWSGCMDVSIEAKPGQARARRATLIGLLAVPMWALLPALTKAAGDVPPLQLVATTFAIGATLGATVLATDRG